MSHKRSAALEKWRTDRAAALDSLVAVHEKVAVDRRGRRYATEQLNRALFVALAGEFQGHCRDLHDDMVLLYADGLGPATDPRVISARSAMIRGRRLSTGNANPSALGNDFKYFGMDFWSSMKAAYPGKNNDWNRLLERLNETRNAIAHRDDIKMATLQDPLTLATFKRWRSTLNTITVGIDKVVAAYLQETIGKSW